MFLTALKIIVILALMPFAVVGAVYLMMAVITMLTAFGYLSVAAAYAVLGLIERVWRKFSR